MHRFRGGLVWAAAAAAVVVAAPATAWAHVEAEADKTQPGAVNVKVTFTAEAESQSAGILGMRVSLQDWAERPAIALDSAPMGWKLTATDIGYDIAGPALPTGDNAVYVIIVSKLPATSPVYFKTIVRYADGEEEPWTDVPAPGTTGEPPNPAPAITLSGAPASTPATTQTSTAAPTTTAPTAAASPASSSASTAPSLAADDSGSKAPLVVAAAIALAMAAGGGLVLARRRRSAH